MKTTSNTATPHKPRMRESCDACGNAKLKCDRAHPSCSRCVARGQSCVYSLCRKMGKPPKKKKDQESEPNDSTRAPSPVDLSDCITGDDLALHYWTTGGPFSDHDPLGDDTAEMMTSMQLPIDATCATHFPAGKAFDDVYHGFASPYHTDPSLLQHGYNFSVASSISDADPFLLASPTISRHPSITDPPLSASMLASACNNDYRCVQDVHDILNDLGNASSLGLQRNLQAVFAAVQRSKKLLMCSCSTNPTLLLLHASILSQIVQVYTQAAQEIRQFEHSPVESHQDFITPQRSLHMSHFPKRTAPPNHARRRVGSAEDVSLNATTPFTFNAENQDQTDIAISLHLLRTEIQHLGTLLGFVPVSVDQASSQPLFDEIDFLSAQVSNLLRHETSPPASQMSSPLGTSYRA